jgi:tetratricopeptide (TPR) repeat protein
MPEAIAAYRKSLPLAKDGEPALNLARILSNEEDYAGSKAAAKEALAKGLKRPGDAWMVIGRSEFGLGNKAALVAAYKEAAKYPESKQQAEEWLRKNGSK